MDILGVRVDNLDREEILEKISCFLSGENFHQVATVNPEFILEAQENEEFKGILNNCDLNIADGFGIKLAFFWLGKKLKCRITGIDLMWEILKIANAKKMKACLVANSNGLSTFQETKKSILKKYPDLIIDGTDVEKNNSSFSLKITDCDVLFCNFGAPFQEKFLDRKKNGTIKLAVGVGGSFDYITGKIRRAPLFMRKIGMEWLFRLWQQPKRIKRIWNAVVKFTFKIIIN